jgi:hypothetical protein
VRRHDTSRARPPRNTTHTARRRGPCLSMWGTADQMTGAAEAMGRPQRHRLEQEHHGNVQEMPSSSGAKLGR